MFAGAYDGFGLAGQHGGRVAYSAQRWVLRLAAPKLCKTIADERTDTRAE